MKNDIVISDIESRRRQLILRARLACGYVFFSIIPIAILSSIFESDHVIMMTSVKVQIYSSLAVIIYGLWCNRTARNLIADKQDIDTIHFYSDVHDGHTYANALNDELSNQGRLITVYEAEKYAKHKKNNKK